MAFHTLAETIVTSQSQVESLNHAIDDWPKKKSCKLMAKQSQELSTV